jgi:hypothetical protein
MTIMPDCQCRSGLPTSEVKLSLKGHMFDVQYFSHNLLSFIVCAYLKVCMYYSPVLTPGVPSSDFLTLLFCYSADRLS